MKILLLADEFNEKAGGATCKAYHRAFCLAKQKNVQVFVITTTPCKELNKTMKKLARNLEVYYIYASYYRKRSFWIHFRNYLVLFNPATVFQVKKIIKKIKPDIVHAHNIHVYLSYHCLYLAKKYSKAVFLNAHDTMLVSYDKFDGYIDQNTLEIPKKFNYKVSFWNLIKQAKWSYNPLRNIIIKFYLRYVDKVLAISQSLADFLQENGIKNVQVLYNGIYPEKFKYEQTDLERFKKKYGLQNKKVVLFGGRVNKLKGASVSADAMKSVIERLDDAVLLVAGDEESYNNSMKENVLKLGISDKVVCSGWLGPEEMKLAYGICDVCVYPSIYLDALGTIHLEAMAAKKPVVGSCFGGTPEVVVDSVTGYIVNPLNVEMMADKIVKILTDKELARKFGEAGYERVCENFTMENNIRNSLAIYREFLR